MTSEATVTPDFFGDIKIRIKNIKNKLKDWFKNGKRKQR